jgi:hypothetical protein
MNKTELLEGIAAISGLSKPQAQKAFDGLLETLASALQAGDKVSIRRFASFALEVHDEDGVLSTTVAVQVSPAFVERCIPQEEAPPEEPVLVEPTTDVPVVVEALVDEVGPIKESPTDEWHLRDETELIVALRELLVQTPSPRLWDKIVELLQWHAPEAEESQLAIRYVREHIEREPGWLVCSLRGGGHEGMSPPRPTMESGPEERKVFVDALLAFLEESIQADKLQKKLNKLKKSGLSTFAKKFSPEEMSGLAMTGQDIHPAGWHPNQLDDHLIFLDELREVEKDTRLAKKGLRLLPLHCKHESRTDYVLAEGRENSHDHSINASLWLVCPKTHRFMFFQAVGAYSYEESSWGDDEVSSVYDRVTPMLSVDGEPLLSHFNREGIFFEGSELDDWREDLEMREVEEELENLEESLEAVSRAISLLQSRLKETFPERDWEKEKELRSLLEGLCRAVTDETYPMLGGDAW